MAGHRPCSIGIMSGTSLDAVDVVALESTQPLKAVAHVDCAIPVPLRKVLARLTSPLTTTLPAGGAGQSADTLPADPIELLGDARRELTDLYAQTCNRLPASIRQAATVIGAHGQTIRHRPERGFSLQILDGARLAELTGLPVVADFRAADLAAGGQGAPLAPAFHQAMLRNHPAYRSVVNIGGIANVTVLSESDRRIVAGFDTGPGNRLMDDWCERHLGEPFDRDGNWAASGLPDARLLQALCDNDYLKRSPPKSTGREDFSMQWLDSVLARHIRAGESIRAEDVQATLLELTALTITKAIAPLDSGRLLICGGGAFNTRLMARLDELHPGGCEPSDAAGIGPQRVEGAAFAWLADRRLAGITIDLSGTTGASGPRLLGAIYPAPPAR